ncbi:MAG TPA: hypothetical protein VIU61_07015 [Kofleriaceae bacterium]
MNAAQVAVHVATRLDEDGIPYAIGGALALGTWGAPRATSDVDLSVFSSKQELAKISDALERAGMMFDRSAAAKDVDRIGLFKGFIGRTRVDIFMSDHPHMSDMHRRRICIDGLWFISAEDLTVMKLIYGRDKDLIDLERLFAVRPQLDVVYVRHWLDQMVPAGDRRHVTLEDLARRFLNR